MLAFLRNLFAASAADKPSTGIIELDGPGDGVVRAGDYDFHLWRHAEQHEALPHPLWPEVKAWIAKLPQGRRVEAWCAAERAWLLWLRDALGDHYRVYESAEVLLLTAQEPRPASVTALCRRHTAAGATGARRSGPACRCRQRNPDRVQR